MNERNAAIKQRLNWFGNDTMVNGQVDGRANGDGGKAWQGRGERERKREREKEKNHVIC